MCGAVPPPAPECGDGIVQDGEDCEPPGQGGCDDNCQFGAPLALRMLMRGSRG